MAPIITPCDATFGAVITNINLAALDDASCATLAGRLARRAEIDAALTAWCAERDAFEQAEQLRDAGVPAYVSLRATDFHADPQLVDREFFVELDHVDLGR